MPPDTPWESLLRCPQVAHRETIPASKACAEPVPADLHPSVSDALRRAGIDALFTHQAEALALASRGQHVIVSTGTASGKSLAFNLPVLDAIARDARARALYVYPAKALAQDQARSLARLGVPGLRAAIYDGDTDPAHRRELRRHANVVLTNPDMLHVGLLPHHDRWADFLADLRFVVIDEAHVYRGVFGSHVGNVIRRLRRLASIYRATPQFLLASATLANPGGLAQALTGLDAGVVGLDGAPRAERSVCLWNPELVDPQLGQRASAVGDAGRLLAELVTRGLRTIVFAKSRRAAEIVHRVACGRLDHELAERLSPYRAGYTPEQRRAVERRLGDGRLLGVAATSALELGIDIGLLDCAISVGFPGTVASLHQQWGRAGRQRGGLAVLIASDDALDQFFMRDPASLLRRPVEAAILDHGNPRILKGHVMAAAFEAPISETDAATLGAAALGQAEALATAGRLRKTTNGYAWASREYPAAGVSLRGGGTDGVTVVETETGSILGLVEVTRAPSTVHEGAVYLHLGDAYRVLSSDGSIALVEPFSGDYYTQTKHETSTTISETVETATKLGVSLAFGHVSVTEQVVAYQRRSLRDGSVLRTHALVLPTQTFETEAVWFVPPEPMLAGLHKLVQILGTLHAAEHALIALLPAWAMCDRWDIGGLSTNLHPQTGRPTVFVYEGHPEGVGIARRGFDVFEGWVRDTAALLTGCPCRQGCPSCVQSPKCGNLNEPLDKNGASALLRSMLAHQRG